MPASGNAKGKWRAHCCAMGCSLLRKGESELVNTQTLDCPQDLILTDEEKQRKKLKRHHSRSSTEGKYSNKRQNSLFVLKQSESLQGTSPSGSRAHQTPVYSLRLTVPSQTLCTSSTMTMLTSLSVKLKVAFPSFPTRNYLTLCAIRRFTVSLST